MNVNKIAVIAFYAHVPVFEESYGLSRKELDNMTFDEKCNFIQKMKYNDRALFIRTWETLYEFQEDLNNDEIEIHDYFVYFKDVE